MKPTTFAPQLPLQTRSASPVLDIVVPFTTRLLPRAALTAAGRLSAELLPLIRIVRTQVVPFPLQVENAPISAGVLHGQLIPRAEEFGAPAVVLHPRYAVRPGSFPAFSDEDGETKEAQRALFNKFGEVRELSRWPGSFRKWETKTVSCQKGRPSIETKHCL